MPGLPFWPAWSEAAVLYGGVLLVWALALYVTSRGEPHRVPVLAALAMTTLSVYLFGQALGGLSTDLSVWATWLARTWAGAALGPGFWLLLTQALVVEEGAEPLRAWATRLYWPLAVAVLALGGGFAVVGTITELVEQWSGASELNPVLRLGSGAVRHISDGPLFGIFRWYALVCLVWATANIGLLWRSSGRGTPLHARFTWLLLSGV